MAAVPVDGQFAGLEVVLQVEDTRVFADGEELGRGLLSVEGSNLCWSCSDGSDERLTLEYPSIALHAVSRDTSSFPHHCVYLQCLQPVSEGGDDDEVREGEGEDEEVVEYRLVPPLPEHLNEIYQAITHCQSLYPDPEQSDSEEGEGEGEKEREGEETHIDLEGGEFFTTADGLDHLSPQGLTTLSHLERLLQHPSSAEFEATISNGKDTQETPDQFEDAD